MKRYAGLHCNDVEVRIKSLTITTTKTRTVISMTQYRILNGISPSQICLFTFTNKAANEMKERISNLIGLSNESDPVKIEQVLIKIFPKEYLKDINHLFVWHGRNTCIARKPKCDLCSVKEFCKHYKNSNSIKI